MSALLAEIVDWHTLGEVALYSLLARVGLTVAFSLSILGATRFVDRRREGRTIPAGFYALLLAAGTLATVAALVVGFIVMTTKG